LWGGGRERCTVAYANRNDLVSGAGSRLHGGRWNSPGRFNAVYGSLSAQGAVAESLATFHSFGVPPAKARPRVFAALALKLQRVLDMTASNVVDMLDLDYATVLAEDWKAAQDANRESVAQALGRIAWELKLEGIVVPSAVAEGEKNIVVFPGRRLRGSSWRIQGARDLPRKT
jgi:RES domain-containing protein